jgi:hypothetical protein
MADECTSDAWQRRRFELVFVLGREHEMGLRGFKDARDELERVKRMERERRDAERERRQAERRCREEAIMWV